MELKTRGKLLARRLGGCRRQAPCLRTGSNSGVLAAGAIAVVTFVSSTFAPTSARGDDLSAVYLKVKPSVVYIVCARRDGISSGSGFVYASGEMATSIVTANHVVDGALKIDVILDSLPALRYHATVVKHNRLRDVAELSIPLGHRLALKLQGADAIREGMSIAAVGYPRAAKKFEELMGDDLRPSVHGGIVSAVRLHGDVVQFDADTDSGDSGGPVIDARSGLVIGVVRGGLLDQSYVSAGLEALPGSNFAASSSSIVAVVGEAPNSIAKTKAATESMKSANLAMAAATSALAAAITGMTAANAKMSAAVAAGGASPEGGGAADTASSAAYRVGFETPRYDDPIVDAAAARLSTRLSEHFASGNEVYVVPVIAGMAEASNSRLASYCDDTRLNAIMAPHVRLSPAGSAGDAGRKVYVTVDLRVTDCSGRPFFFGEVSMPKAIALATHSQDRDVLDMFDGTLDKLIGDFDRFKESHARAWTSLLKIGFALDPEGGHYYSLFGIDRTKEFKEWRVTSVYSDGPGADAGLQPSDTITAIDGHPTRGLSEDAVRLLTDKPKYTISVLRPGGLTVLKVNAKKYAELQATLKR